MKIDEFGIKTDSDLNESYMKERIQSFNPNMNSL